MCLIAASSLKNKDDLLERMKSHMEAQQQKEQQQAPMMQRHAEATVAGLEAKAAADAALARERQHAVVAGIHDVHAQFAAAPYGQPFVAPPDAPSAPGASMTPEMMAAQHAADVRATHAKATAEEMRAMHERHKAANTITDTRMMHHQMTHPQPTQET